jgi:hypothetical protein
LAIAVNPAAVFSQAALPATRAAVGLVLPFQQMQQNHDEIAF